MSEHLAAAAQALNAPEVLVQRSAEARAKASSSTADVVLAAWAGGEAAPAAPAAPPPPAPEPEVGEPAAQPEPEAALEPADETQGAPVDEPIPVAVATAVEEEEPVVAASVGRRMRVSGRAGALFGAVFGLGAVLFGAQWLLPRATSVMSEGGTFAAIDVVAGWLIIGFGLTSAAIGVAVAGMARMVTGWFGPGMRLVSSHGASAILGGVAGFLTGALLGAIVAGSGTPNDLVEGVTTVSALGTVLWSVLGWVVSGWAIGSLVQAFGVPEGVVEEEANEAAPVKRRLATAFGLPALTALVILVVVLPVAYVFISYPTWAPLTGIFIAGSILGFAGLAASRPGMKITAGEFFIAVAGIGVVVVIIAAVLSIQGGGHGEEDHSDAVDDAAVTTAIV